MKQGASSKLDSLLRDWQVAPPPSLAGDSSDAAWEERAAEIVERARGAAKMEARELDVLSAPPKLEPEAGEPTESGALGMTETLGGEKKKMSDDRDPPSAAKPSLRSGRSLKELAERVSKTPPPPSVDRASSPGPERISVPPAPPAPRIAATESAPATKASPAVAAAAPPSVAPASTKVEAVAAAAPEPAPAKAKEASPASKTPATLPTGAKPAEKKGGGMVILLGGAVVALAAAAGVAFYLHSQKATSTAPTAPEAAAVKTSKPAPGDEAKPDKNEPKPEVAKQDPNALDVDKLADSPTASSREVAVGPGGVRVAPSASAVAAADTTKDGPHHINPDGTLNDAMEKAAGGTEQRSPDAQPASGDAQPKNLPDMPPTGSVTAAIGSVRGAARACVAGADKDSVAVITFNSAGAAQGVSVGGWAADKPAAAACIQSALMRAHVEPFTKPTFQAPVTIRP